MSKGYCSVFPNLAERVADKLSSSIPYANAFISTYNRYAKAFKMEKIKDSEDFEAVSAKIDAFSSKINNTKLALEFRTSLQTLLKGNALSYHYEKLQRIFPDNAIYNDLIQDFTRIFLMMWDSMTAEQCGLKEDRIPTAKEKKLAILKTIKNGQFIMSLLGWSWIENKTTLTTKGDDNSILGYYMQLKSLIQGPVEGIDEQFRQENLGRFKEQLDLITKIVTNANSLFTMALPTINSIIDVQFAYDILDASYEYNSDEDMVSDIEDLSTAENDPNKNIDEEVTILEHWMEILDHADPTGSLSEIVKKVLMLVPMYRTESKPVEIEDASGYKVVVGMEESLIPIVTSTFEMPRISNPDTEARRLLRILYKANNVTQMMTLLESVPRYRSLYETLSKDVRMQVTFFQAFNKIQQDLTEVTSGYSGGKRSYNTPILNRIQRKSTVKSFLRGLQRVIPTQNSIFIISGNKLTTNFAEYYKLTQLVKRLFDNNFEEFNKLNYNSKVSYITYIVEKLGIPITPDAAGEIISDTDSLHDLIEPILTICNETNERVFNSSSGLYRNNRNETLVHAITNNSILSDAFKKVLKVVDSKDEFSNAYTNMTNYNGSTLSTYILPSIINNLIKRIKFMGEEEIMQFLDNRYFQSPLYAQRDEKGNITKIYSRWLRDFAACAGAERGSIRTRFGVSRCLGIDGTPTDKISDSQHALIQLQTYFKGRRSNTNNIEYISREPKDFEDFLSLLAERDLYPNVDKVYYIEGSPKAVKIDDLKISEGNITGTIVKDVYRDDFAVIQSFVTGDTNALRFYKSLHYNEEEILEGMYDLYLADIADQNQKRAFRDAGYTMRANDKITYTDSISKFSILQFLNEDKYRERLNSIIESSKGDNEAIKEALKDLFKDYITEEVDSYIKSLDVRGLNLLEKETVTINDGRTTQHKEVYKHFATLLSEDATEEDFKELIRDFILNYEFSQFNQSLLAFVHPGFFESTETYQKRNKAGLTNGTQGAEDAIDPESKKHVWNQNNVVQKVVAFFDIITSDEGSNFFEALQDIFKDHPNKESILKSYKANSLTDGFSLRTFESYRKVLLGQGKQLWTDNMEKAYQIIDKIRKQMGPNDNIADFIVEVNGKKVNALEYITSLGIVFQPIKPIGQFIEHFAGNHTIGVQLKYAEFPIIPELYPPGSNQRLLGYFMEGRDRNGKQVREPIDLLASSTCFKEGCFGEVDLQYKTVKSVVETTDEETGEIKLEERIQYVNTDGEIIKGYRFDDEGNKVEVENPTIYEQRLNDNFADEAVPVEGDIMSILESQLYEGSKAVVHELNVSGMLIQSNKPVHPENEVTVSTQGQKIILGAINDDSDYSSVNIKSSSGKKLTTGKQVKELLQELLCAGYGRGLLKFLNIISKENRGLLSTRLANQIASNRRNNIGNLMKISLEEDDFRVPLFDKSISHDTIPNILSLFKKWVIKQKTYGVSFIQASAIATGIERIDKPSLGFTTVEVNGKKNIVSCDMECGWIFTYKDVNGNEIPIQREKYVDKDGYFLDIHGNPIKEDRWHPADGVEVQSLLERDYPGILDVVANRTPAEMEYSMFRLRIRKVNARVGDNTIKLPLASTTIAGFDFDIDSLTVMIKEFRRRKLNIDNNKVWAAFYSTPLGSEILTHMLLKLGVGGFTEDGDYEGEWDNLNITRKFDITKNEAFDLGIQTAYGSQWEEYDLDKSAFEQTSAACRNAVLEIYLAVLSHPDTLNDRYVPGGFPMLKRTSALARNLTSEKAKENTLFDYEVDKDTGIRRVKSLKGLTDKYLKDNPARPTYNYANPLTAIIFKLKNQIADTLIGVAANDDMSHIISKNLKITYGNGSAPIKFGSLLTDVYEINGVTEESNPELFNTLKNSLGTNFNIQSINGVSIKRMIAEILDGSVDAVKENALEALNLNIVTIDVAIAMIKAGHSFDDIALFMNQPIIKEMCSVISRTGTSNNYVALNKAFERFGFDSINVYDVIKNGTSIPNLDYLSSEALAYNIVYLSGELTNDSDKIAFVKSQLEVAKMFLQANSVRREYSAFVQDTRHTSSNVAPSTCGEWESRDSKRVAEKDRMLKVEDASGNNPVQYVYNEEGFTIDNVESLKALFTRFKDNPIAFEMFVGNITGYALNKLFREFTPYLSSLYKNIKTTLKRYIPYYSMNDELINDINDSILDLLVKDSNGDLNPFNVISFTATDGSELNPNRLNTIDLLLDCNFLVDIAKKMTPEEIEALTSSFLYRQIIEEEVVEGRPKFSIKFSFNNNSLNAIKQSWSALYNDGKNGTLSAFAKALFIHYYLNNGLSNTSNFNHGAVPESIMSDIIVQYGTDGIGNVSFYDFERALINEDYEGLGFVNSSAYTTRKAVEYMLANVNNPKIVPNISYNPSFNLNDNILEISAKNSYIVRIARTKEGSTYAPFIIYKGKLFVLDGFLNTYNNLIPGSEGTIRYKEYSITIQSEYKAFSNDNNSYLISSKVSQDENIPEFSGELDGSPVPVSAKDNINKLEEDIRNTKAVDAEGVEICNSSNNNNQN